MGRVPFIVMELIQGETLRDVVRREGRLDPKKAASIMASVCDALTASHHAGIIHRDIKPAEHHADQHRQGEGDGLRHRSRAR